RTSRRPRDGCRKERLPIGGLLSARGGTCRNHAPALVGRVIHDPQGPYTLRTTPTVRRALAETLTEAVAAAAYKFITGPLLEEPHRVGKRLLPPLKILKGGGYIRA